MKTRIDGYVRRACAGAGCTITFALLAMAADSWPGAALPDPIAYHLTAEVGGAAWGEWSVEQGGEVAVARRPAGGDPVLLTGSALEGSVAAEPNEQGFLVTLLGTGADVGAGFRRPSPFGSGMAVVDSVRFDLREGETDETLAGHDARHYELTAHLWWRHLPDSGAETAVTESGTADLWFAGELPFSWMPFAVAPGQPGLALPLSQNWPEVAPALIEELGPRLTDLGLLLRARVVDQVRPEDNPDAPAQLVGTDYERSVTAADVQPLAEAPDAAELLALPRISSEQMAALRPAGAMLRDCRALAPEAGGSFDMRTSGAREFMGGGSGALLTGAGDGRPGAFVVMGRFDGQRLECTAIRLPDDAPVAGAYPLGSFTGQAAGGANTQEAQAVHAIMEGREVHRMIVLEAGEVRLSEVGDGTLTGELEAEGWGLELNPAYPRHLFPELGMVASFEAVAGSGG